MESLRESLAAGYLMRIEKELGREATLRLLWPHIVGTRLAGNAQLTGIRGSTLLLSVPDRSWLGPLSDLEKMILDAVNRWGSERAYDSIEFLEQPQMAPPREASRPKRGNRESGPRACPEPAEGNRLPEERRFTPVEFDTGMITDEKLRRLFLESARKYFARQECRRS